MKKEKGKNRFPVRLFTLCLVITMLFSATLSGCGSSSTGGDSSSGKGIDKNIKATITIANSGNENDKKVAFFADENFKKKYPNVKIVDNFNAIPSWGEYSDKIVALIASGNAPDIVNIAIEGTRMMVSKNILAPLDDLIANDPQSKELLADIDPALINAFKVDGKLYEIPTGFNDMLIHYNPKLFKDAGVPEPTADWTWDDFLDAAKKLTKGEGENKVYGFAIPAFHFALIPWFLTNGTNTLTDDWTDSNLNDPKAIEAMQFVRDLVYVHKVSPMPEANVDPAKLFQAGRAAMTGFGFWTVPDYNNNEFKDFAMAKWPSNGTSSTTFGVGGVGITSSCKNKELAWELIKEYSSKETIEYNVQFGTAVPARKSIAASDAFLNKALHANLFYDVLPTTKPVPAPANFSEMEGIFMRHFSEFMADQVSVQDAMNAAHEELSAAMKKLKK